MIYNFAFIGTGECDPNKGLKQFAAGLALIASFVCAAWLLGIVHRSGRSSLIRLLLTLIIIIAVVGVSFAVALYLWIGLACSR